MITNEGLRELVAALAGRAIGFPTENESGRIVLSYEEIESGPEVDLVFDPEREVVEIRINE